MPLALELELVDSVKTVVEVVNFWPALKSNSRLGVNVFSTSPLRRQRTRIMRGIAIHPTRVSPRLKVQTDRWTDGASFGGAQKRHQLQFQNFTKDSSHEAMQ